MQIVARIEHRAAGGKENWSGGPPTCLVSGRRRGRWGVQKMECVPPTSRAIVGSGGGGRGQKGISKKKNKRGRKEGKNT